MADSPNFSNNIVIKIVAVFFFGIIAFLINFICYIFVLDLFKNSIGWILLPLILFIFSSIIMYANKIRKYGYIFALLFFPYIVQIFMNLVQSMNYSPEAGGYDAVLSAIPFGIFDFTLAVMPFIESKNKNQLILLY